LCSPARPSSAEARERIGAELQAALVDLKGAPAPARPRAPETHTTLLQEVERLRREHRDLGLALRPGSDRVHVPRELESLAQSVLAEAVRNAHKHARPTSVEVGLERQDGALVLDVCNDGVRGRPKQTGMGLGRGAEAPGRRHVEFGERNPGTWRVRLAVPVDRRDMNPSRIATGSSERRCACWSSTTTRCHWGRG
jgi:hypothetical protein